MSKNDGIKNYVGCRECYETKPAGISMERWSQISVGLTRPDTLRVWCERHDRLIEDVKLAHRQTMRCDICGGPIEDGHAHTHH